MAPWTYDGPFNANAGKGKGIAWLRAHLGHTGAGCLIWPYSRDDYGYGQLSYDGVKHKASALMCELAHGPRPAREYESAHSCGNGRGGCTHPQHLSWKTRKENAADMVKHGTAPQKGRLRRKLNADQVREILALKGVKSQREIGRMFGMSNKQISKIHLGQAWAHVQPTLPAGPVISRGRSSTSGQRDA